MIPHFNAVQAPDPSEIPPPHFETDDAASIHSDKPEPESPEPEDPDADAAPVEPYSWTRIPRTSGLSRTA
jgi:hypothetical protein